MDTFWVGVAFVIFLAILAYFGVPRMIVKSLDARGEKVAQELAEARRLRQEAERLLAEYDAKRKAAETEAAEIVAQAKEEAARLAAEAEAKLNDFVARRTKAAQDKIALAESQAEAEVRAAAADAAARAAELILRGKVSGPAGDRLFEAGLGEVKAKLN
jgi:F-type H+-transporting ATPase subunit b